MANALAGVESIIRCVLPQHPSIFLFQASRRGQRPLYIVWEKRDVFAGEDTPATPIDFDWTSPGATATDAEGKITPVKIEGGRVSLAVSVTPVFIETC